MVGCIFVFCFSKAGLSSSLAWVAIVDKILNMNVDIGTMLVHPKMIYFVFYRQTINGPVYEVPVHTNISKSIQNRHWAMLWHCIAFQTGRTMQSNNGSVLKKTSTEISVFYKVHIGRQYSANVELPSQHQLVDFNFSL